jgi:hypothetical protein
LLRPSGVKSHLLRYYFGDKNRWKHVGRVGVVRLNQVIDTAKRDMAKVEEAKKLETFHDPFKRWLAEHDRTASRVRARFALAIISAELNWAENNDLTQAIPTPGLKLPGSEPLRTRIHSEDELRRF